MENSAIIYAYVRLMKRELTEKPKIDPYIIIAVSAKRKLFKIFWSRRYGKRCKHRPDESGSYLQTVLDLTD
jgi:hypothetical protein